MVCGPGVLGWGSWVGSIPDVVQIKKMTEKRECKQLTLRDIVVVLTEGWAF